MKRLMIMAAGWLSDPFTAAIMIGLTTLLEVLCIIWPEIDTPVTTHLSFIAIDLALILLAAGKVDTDAVHKKLDETIRAMPEADNAMIGLEKEAVE